MAVLANISYEYSGSYRVIERGIRNVKFVSLITGMLDKFVLSVVSQCDRL
jgi:hypothetical protein